MLSGVKCKAVENSRFSISLLFFWHVASLLDISHSEPEQERLSAHRVSAGMHGGSLTGASLYAVLGVKTSASTAEIRAAYLEHARRYHPDKLQQLRGSTASLQVGSDADVIRRINQAYVTLSDDVLRAQYDHKLSLSASVSSANQPRISATVDFEAFLPSETGTATMQFTYPCRCGSSYTIDEDQVHDLVELIGCSGCSEVIRVRYDSEA